MNKKGFTLVELLATIVILGIVIGITIITSNKAFKNAKEKSEGVFIKTIEDALNVYIDTDARKLSFGSGVICTLNKTTGKAKLYKATTTFKSVINSSYSPITLKDLVNPANQGASNYQCSANGTLNIYRDEDYVYYYKIAKNSFGCLNGSTGYITNLPSGCNG